MKLWATFFKFQYYSCKKHLKIINRGTWGKRKNEEQKKLGNMRNGGNRKTGEHWAQEQSGNKGMGQKSSRAQGE